MVGYKKSATTYLSDQCQRIIAHNLKCLKKIDWDRLVRGHRTLIKGGQFIFDLIMHFKQNGNIYEINKKQGQDMALFVPIQVSQTMKGPQQTFIYPIENLQKKRIDKQLSVILDHSIEQFNLWAKGE